MSVATIETLERSAKASAPDGAYRVLWLGDRPWWLDDAAARAVLGDVEPGPPARDSARPFVVHATAPMLRTLGRASRDRLVADLCGVERLDRAGARVARSASVVLVDDPARLELLGRGQHPTWSLLRTPLDLREHAPLRVLRERRDRDLKRFRRVHRLSPHTILYAGPYRSDGGWLELLLEAASLLRERYDDLVVAAIPEGEVEARYRDACERRALALGHRAIVEWEVPAEERPLWYAYATVVCAGASASPLAPAHVSAAAGAPTLARADDPSVSLPGALAPDPVEGGAAELAARLDAILADPARAAAAGGARRRAAEAELSPSAAARRLRALWSGLAVVG